jgi:PTH1 family peptidyl-tRNA hydrolase
VEYVLGRWTSKEEKILIPRIETAVEIIKSFVLAGATLTMSEYNNK